MKTYGITDIGLVRKYNEDRYLIKDLDIENGLLLAVADGMGGHPGAEIVSSAVSDALASFIPTSASPESELKELIRELSEKILAQAQAEESLFGMGSTVTAVIVLGTKAHWVHVGDSRLYHFSGQNHRQITTDQNWAQSLVEYGDMSPEEARTSPLRNMLDECVGCPDCQPMTGQFSIRKHDRLFLSTDGVHDYLEPDFFMSLLSEKVSLKTRMDKVMQAVLDAGGEDNSTLVGLEI